MEDITLFGQMKRRLRSAIFAAVFFSLAINLLILTAPLYMLQIYDSVLTSRSVDTLILLTLIAAIALVALAALDALRSQILLRVGIWFERSTAAAILRAHIRAALIQRQSSGTQGLRDISTLRNFLSGPAMAPLLDAPWVPIFLVVIFLFHYLLGLVALTGALLLFGMALLNERSNRTALIAAGQGASKALQSADAAVRNADAIEAMGMAENIVRRWRSQEDAYTLKHLLVANSLSGTIASISKFIRLLVQISVMATGAWLFIQGELTPGGMIAASVLMSRALAPVEQSIGGWRQFVNARSAYGRLKKILSHYLDPVVRTALPRPKGILSAEEVTYFYAGQKKPTLHAVSFTISGGEALGLIGPTAAGKSTLARLLVGSLKPGGGHVRLDGMDVTEWDSDDRGQYFGYVPQDVELFPGTVKENIARLGQASDEDAILAAKIARAHDMIMRLPQGYDTELGEAGFGLSGGQKQRIALARALYGNPAVVVLDEPSANLDTEGEAALMGAMAHLKELGATVVIIAHKPSLLRRVDRILVLRDGKVAGFGERDAILSRVSGPTPVANQKREQS